MSYAKVDEIETPNRVPVGAIRLSDAFEIVYRTLTPGWEALSERCVQSNELEQLDAEELEQIGQDFPLNDPYREEWEATSLVETIFRRALHEGELSACIYTRQMGKILVLDPKLWLRFGSAPGIRSDFTAPTDPNTPGPDCDWKGMRLPVFLMSEPFTAWLRNRRFSVLKFDSDLSGIVKELSTARILTLIVAYFLEHHVDGVPADQMTAEIHEDIIDFLRRRNMRKKTVDRKTIKSGYELAQRIARRTRSPADWELLGVPKSQGSPR